MQEKCVLHLRVHAIVVINVNTVLGLLLFCQFDASSATSTSPIEYCLLYSAHFTAGIEVDATSQGPENWCITDYIPGTAAIRRRRRR